MGYDTQEGLPSAWLLLFTLMLWTLFAAILLSNRKSRINQWGFISGMLFSLGVLKEYVYFGLVPQIAGAWPDIPADIYQGIYSVMTAILYYWCMPCTLVLAFHFGELPARRPRLYAVCRILVFVPGLIWGLAVPYQDTRYYQLAVPAYFPAATVYNWIYGIGVTLLMLMTLYRERLSARFQQKKFIAVTTLLPLWYWLITALLFHSLRLRRLFKAWQGNFLIVGFLLIYFGYHIFRSGIWGSRLYRVEYDPLQDTGQIHRNTGFVNHALKNELVKLEWCAHSLRQQFPEDTAELRIIENSARHLQEFIKRSSVLSRNIFLQCRAFPVYPVLEWCIREAGVKFSQRKLHWELECPRDALIFTDREHLIEMINNLLYNGAEATDVGGTIRISYGMHRVIRYTVLTVADTGCGISREEQARLFQPYYTTKGASFQHMGLGLYYCFYVMEKQHGGIRVKSIPGRGTTFFLYFPLKKNRCEVRYESEKNTDPHCGG